MMSCKNRADLRLTRAFKEISDQRWHSLASAAVVAGAAHHLLISFSGGECDWD
jgi:hypothetical protein